MPREYHLFEDQNQTWGTSLVCRLAWGRDCPVIRVERRHSAAGHSPTLFAVSPRLYNDLYFVAGSAVLVSASDAVWESEE